MSKAFTNEDNEAPQPEPTATPPKAGSRYVTPEGWDRFQKEAAQVTSLTKHRTLYLENLLATATVKAPPPNPDRAVFGTWVSLADEVGAVTVYRLVGPDESNAKERHVTVGSPLGQAMLGAEVGVTVEAVLPQQKQRTFKITAISSKPPA